MQEPVQALLRTLPRKIRVGAYDWRIKVEAGVSEDYGETDYDNAVVAIWPEEHQSPDRLVGTLVHELIHVIDPDLGEETVVKLENGLISLFRDNPKLLTWIKRGLKSTQDGQP
ncbi:hypothetical protein [Bradyrhizobium sp. SZCCHNRI2049]|uniref:hypothetical protein n=1 Tax=Bradyrhizobium sp. SZCCHNRI2049 TaxID=3057287 RepID=UPI00291698D3|nr:hypothetical protein [Bradyrhizobium sp. SZCCHNRI2049]